MPHPLCQQFCIDEAEAARRLEILDLLPQDAHRLETVRQIVGPNVASLVDAFYTHLLRFPELSRFISNGQGLGRLRDALTHHLTTLGEGVGTLDYIESRLRIGVAHERNGISHKWYIAAHAHLEAIMIRLLFKQDDVRQAEELLLSLHKVLSLDIELVMETYHRTAITRVEILMRQQENGQEEIRKLAQTDSVSGLFNRRHFFDCLESAFHHCQRNGHPLCLMLLDLDDFKLVNDRFGHQMGDVVLKEIGRLLPMQVRLTDFCARLGGDEFAIALRETSLPTAQLIAERVRLTLMQKEFYSGDVWFSVGVSIGIAVCTASMADVPSLVGAADNSLYQAKNSGKNCLRVNTST